MLTSGCSSLQLRTASAKPSPWQAGLAPISREVSCGTSPAAMTESRCPAPCSPMPQPETHRSLRDWNPAVFPGLPRINAASSSAPLSPREQPSNESLARCGTQLSEARQVHEMDVVLRSKSNSTSLPRCWRAVAMASTAASPIPWLPARQTLRSEHRLLRSAAPSAALRSCHTYTHASMIVGNVPTSHSTLYCNAASQQGCDVLIMSNSGLLLTLHARQDPHCSGPAPQGIPAEQLHPGLLRRPRRQCMCLAVAICGALVSLAMLLSGVLHQL